MTILTKTCFVTTCTAIWIAPSFNRMKIPKEPAVISFIIKISFLMTVSTEKTFMAF